MKKWLFLITMTIVLLFFSLFEWNDISVLSKDEWVAKTTKDKIEFVASIEKAYLEKYYWCKKCQIKAEDREIIIVFFIKCVQCES